MRLYVDLDTGNITGAVGLRAQMDRVEFKRGDSARVEVQFFRAATVIELAAGASGIFGIKEDGKYDGGYLVSDLSWTKEGTGTNTVYVFEPNFNTTELNALLNHNPPNDTDDVASVVAMLEIEWMIGGLIASTRTTVCVIHNDVIKGTEGPPTPSPTPISDLRDVESDLVINAAGVTAQNYPATVMWRTRWVEVQQGTGAYTHNILLAEGGALAGSVMRFYFKFTAGTNPTVNVRSGSITDPVIFTQAGEAAAYDVWADFTFDGTNWRLSAGGRVE